MKRALVLFSILVLSAGVAAAQDAQYEVEIKASAVGAALEAFADQTGLQVAYLADAVSGKQSGGFTGSDTAGEILDALLDGTGLEWSFENDRTVTVAPSASDEGPNVDEEGRFRGEVVVTANLREENPVNVASSMSAYDSTFMDERNIRSINELIALTPGTAVSLADPSNENSIFVIRGIASGIGNSTVGVYVDDVSVGVNEGSLNPSLRLFDMERVEILRGPQGTLYGAGAMGGAIKYVSKKPNLAEIEGQAQLELGSVTDGEHDAALDLAVNVPIVSDKLALRLTGSYVDGGGYIDLPNATAGPSTDGPYEDTNSRTLTTFRGTLRWQPVERLTLDLVAFLDKRDFLGTSHTYSAAESPFVDDIQTIDPSDSGSEYRQLSLNIVYDLRWAELQSISGYFESTTDSLGYFEPRPPFPLSGSEFNNTAKTFSQEFRLVSAVDGRLSWIAGLYFQDVESDLILDVRDAGADIATLIRISSRDRQQVSVYGEADYRLSEKWIGTLGLRYYSEDVLKQNSMSFFGGPPMVTEGDVPFSTTTPRFVLSYQPSDRMNYYGSVSKGFRVGGINASGVPGIPPGFDPDSVWAYEIGVKALGRKVGVTTALYYNDWDNIQTFFFDEELRRSYIVNGNAAHSAGFEVQVEWQATNGLRLGLTGNLSEAEYDEPFLTAGGPIVPGDRLPASPQWDVAFLLAYDAPLTANTVFTARIDGAYAGDQVGLNQEVIKDQSQAWNALIGILWESWELSAFVRNITNDIIFPRPEGAQTVFTQHYNRPRTFGVRVLARF